VCVCVCVRTPYIIKDIYIFKFSFIENEENKALHVNIGEDVMFTLVQFSITVFFRFFVDFIENNMNNTEKNQRFNSASI